MAGEKWNSIKVNFSGANNASANASKALSESAHTLNNISRSMKDRVDTYNKEVKEQERYDAQLARQVQADKYTKFNAESKGYGQGQLVADAMAGITQSGVVDNSGRIAAVDGLYNNLAEITPEMEVVYTAVGNLSGDERLEYGDSKKKQNELAKRILGDKYDKYLADDKAYDTRLEEANSAAMKIDVDGLYKTDAASAQSGILKALMDKGVNPQYAIAMVPNLAAEYTQKEGPVLTEFAKANLKSIQDRKKSIEDRMTTDSRTKSTKVKVGGGGGSSKNTGKKSYNMYNNNTADALTAALSTAKAFGVEDAIFAASGEMKDITEVMKILSKGVPVGKDGKLAYLPVKDIKNMIASKVESSWVSGNQLTDIGEKALIKFRDSTMKEHAAKGRLVYNAGNTSGGNGVTTNNSNVVKSKYFASQADKDVYAALLKQESAAIAGMRNPTSSEWVKGNVGKDLYDSLMGAYKPAGNKVENTVVTVDNKKPNNVVKNVVKNVNNKVNTDEEIVKTVVSGANVVPAANIINTSDMMVNALNKGKDAVAKLAVTDPKGFEESYMELDEMSRKFIDDAMSTPANTKYLDNAGKENVFQAMNIPKQAQKYFPRGGKKFVDTIRTDKQLEDYQNTVMRMTSAERDRFFQSMPREEMLEAVKYADTTTDGNALSNIADSGKELLYRSSMKTFSGVDNALSLYNAKMSNMLRTTRDTDRRTVLEEWADRYSKTSKDFDKYEINQNLLRDSLNKYLKKAGNR